MPKGLQGFQKGYSSRGFLGKHHTKESNEKNRLAHLGKHFSPQTEFKKGYDITKHWNWQGGITKERKATNYYWKIRRIRKYNAEGLHTQGEWEILKKQYGYTCPSCKRKEPEIKLSEDHIIPITKGGSNFIENIQPLCLSCNYKKYNKIIKY